MLEIRKRIKEGDGVKTDSGIDKTVWKETAYVTLGTVLLSAVMVVIYSAISPFEMKILYGAVLGSVAAILNFFFMAFTLQRAVEININGDEDAVENVKLKIKSAYTIRMIVYFLVLACALATDFFNPWTLLVPALFPSMIAKVRMFFLNNRGE